MVRSIARHWALRPTVVLYGTGHNDGDDFEVAGGLPGALARSLDALCESHKLKWSKTFGSTAIAPATLALVYYIRGRVGLKPNCW